MITEKKESNITVAIRVRPLSEKEIQNKEFQIIKVDKKLLMAFDPIDIKFNKKNKTMLEIYHRSREQQYAFDSIYTKKDIHQIYKETAHKLMDPLFKGFNGCVFAYGATGTGKTYTMLGDSKTPGICNLSLKEIFERKKIVEKDQNIELMISYVEIYNEQIRDLLVSKEKKYLDLRDDPLKGTTLSGATKVKVESVNEVMNLLLSGNKRRTTEQTNANLTSSRSHAIFQIYVQISPRSKDIKIEKKLSKLSLIDLAGSERGTVTNNKGIRMREGAKINQSLLALANCINALGDKNRKGSFVPYRDSKLTRMLKDSLGGNCKTVMIVTISPSSNQFEETLNTLKYANRAKNIITKPIENKKLVQFHIAEYKNIITDLKTEIKDLKSQLDNNSVVVEKNENDLCDYCKCGRTKDEEEVKKIKEEFFQNFQDRIQIRRGLCELEAQNQLNKMEIKEGQEKLMRYTISGNGTLIERSNSGKNNKNLPESLNKQLNDIKKLQVSMNLNQVKKKYMKQEIENKSREAKKIMESITKRVKHQDKKDFLEILVKNHILQLENDEFEFNLHLQEKLNIILVDEIKRLRRACQNNGIKVDNLNGDERKEIKKEIPFTKNYKSISPEINFRKKSIPVNINKRKFNLEKNLRLKKKVKSDKKKKIEKSEILPRIDKFHTPKTKKYKNKKKNKEERDKKKNFKSNKENRNTANLINNLQILGQEIINDRVKKNEENKKNTKIRKIKGNQKKISK